MGNAPIHIARVTIAAHYILNGYGHWFPNDIRGSGSIEVRKGELRDLGPIHHGRKRVQPPREDLRAFFREAEPKLDHAVIWFDEAMRNVIGQSFGKTIRSRGYTCWACAVMPNHAHLVIRTHREHHDEIWTHLTEDAHDVLKTLRLIPDDHPVWAARPYAVLMNTRPQILTRLGYVERNPTEARLPSQKWDFVVPCPFRSSR
ncbi:MAG: hypothetical protein QM770_03350 [Tepidisphaeraceae bacterium]